MPVSYGNFSIAPLSTDRPHWYKASGEINRIENIEQLSIAYVFLVHDQVEFTQRTIRTLNESQHLFVIHVDRKFPNVYNELLQFSANHHNVYMVENRVDVIWAAFSVVQATLNAVDYLLRQGKRFDYLINFSGTTYPIKSNRYILKILAQFPSAIYVDYNPHPHRPDPSTWHHYVECDGMLHRIGRIPLARGMNLYFGSQWFMLPFRVVEWIMLDPLPDVYARYAKHIIVADENYFVTLIQNSPYCHDIINTNNVLVVFDKWENEKDEALRFYDPKKCLSPDPTICGRSPITLTQEHRGILKSSYHLFARKFDLHNLSSLLMLQEVDRWRESKEDPMVISPQLRDSSWKDNIIEGDIGSEIMIQQRYSDLCLSLPDSYGSNIISKPCDTTDSSQIFIVGPCTTYPNVTFSSVEDYQLNKASCPKIQKYDRFHIGEFLCEIRSKQNPSACIDLSGDHGHYSSTASTTPPLISWECAGTMNQLFQILEDCKLSVKVPSFTDSSRDVSYEEKCLESYLSEAKVSVGSCWSNQLQEYLLLKIRSNHSVPLTPVSIPSTRNHIKNYNSLPVEMRDVFDKSDDIDSNSEDISEASEL